jgi:ribose 5-phosphate isomerase B
MIEGSRVLRIAVACDHGGFPLKQTILEAITDAGFTTQDLGTDNAVSVDYPDSAYKLGLVLQVGEADRGILICGSGVGACIAANKMDGIYAGVCHDTYSAHQGVEHDRMNVLCLGARIIGPELARELVLAFLHADFIPEERHIRRTDKVRRLEQEGRLD